MKTKTLLLMVALVTLIFLGCTKLGNEGTFGPTISQDLVLTNCETAYAYGGNFASCFQNFGFSNWGWTNGPLDPGEYSFDMMAGAGQCDLNKGTFVGTLTIEYDGAEVTVTYTMNEGYYLDETHLYVDCVPIPNHNGRLTVAPGQYGNQHELGVCRPLH